MTQDLFFEVKTPYQTHTCHVGWGPQVQAQQAWGLPAQTTRKGTVSTSTTGMSAGTTTWEPLAGDYQGQGTCKCRHDGHQDHPVGITRMGTVSTGTSIGMMGIGTTRMGMRTTRMEVWASAPVQAVHWHMVCTHRGWTPPCCASWHYDMWWLYTYSCGIM